MESQPFLERYQELVVGAVGFAGIIATLWANARAGRAQHSFERDTEAEGLRRALIEELCLVRESFESRATSLREAGTTGHDALIPFERMTDVYQRSIERLGLLRHNEITALLRAYVLLMQMPDKLAIMAGAAARPSGGYIRIPTHLMEACAEMHRTHAEPVEAAINALRAGSAAYVRKYPQA